MKQQRDYFCSACEWTDRVPKDEILTECPICGSALTELSAEAEESIPGQAPAQYQSEDLKKVASDEEDLTEL